MKDDIRYSRYFAYLGIFTFSMLIIVLTNNFFTIYVGWELVGLSSYSLSATGTTKKSASDLRKKRLHHNAYRGYRDVYRHPDSVSYIPDVRIF